MLTIRKFSVIGILIVLMGVGIVGCTALNGGSTTTQNVPIQEDRQSDSADATATLSTAEPTATATGPTATIDLTNPPTSTPIGVASLIQTVELFPDSPLAEDFRAGLNILSVNNGGYPLAWAQGIQNNQYSGTLQWGGEIHSLYVFAKEETAYFYISRTSVVTPECFTLQANTRYKIDVSIGFKWRLLRGYSVEPLPNECLIPTATPRSPATATPTP